MAERFGSRMGAGLQDGSLHQRSPPSQNRSGRLRVDNAFGDSVTWAARECYGGRGGVEGGKWGVGGVWGGFLGNLCHSFAYFCSGRCTFYIHIFYSVFCIRWWSLLEADFPLSGFFWSFFSGFFSRCGQVRDRCHLEWKMFQKRWANE